MWTSRQTLFLTLMNYARLPAVVVALLLPALAPATTPSYTTYSFQTVAIGNEPVNDPSVTFLGGGASSPVYDNLGRPILFGVLQGPGYIASNDTTFLRRSGGSFLTEVQEGTAAPDLPGYNFFALYRPVLPDSANDSFAFKALVRNETQATNLSGIWNRGGAGASLVAYEGQAVAGLGSISALSPPACYNNGRTVMSLFGSTPPYLEELWLGVGGTLTRIAAAGSPAPGTPYNFRTSGAPNASINRAGTVVFYWQLDAAGSPTGTWIMSGGGVSPVLVPGDPAPDLPAGVTVDSSAGYINEVGHLVVRGMVNGPGIDGTNASCVWTGPPGSLQLLARAGEPAPGTTASFSYLTVSGFTDDDKVLLESSLAGPGVSGVNDRGLWVGGPAGLTKVMRTGDPAPGTDTGVVFSGYPVATLAESGEISFQTELSGPGVWSYDNDEGIWSTAGGPLSLVLRKSQQFEATPGVFERITDFRQERSGPFAGHPRIHRPNGAFLVNLSLENETTYVSRAGIYEVTPARGPSYLSWKSTVFDPPDVNTPAADPEADFDGDGIANVFEQLFGRDPTMPEAQPEKRLAIEADPAGGFALNYPIVTPIPDIEVGFSTSTDGVTWTPAAAGVVTIDSSTSGVLNHRATFGPESQPGPRGLVRLTATER